MADPAQKKPTIHQSQIGMMQRCGIAFQRRYGQTFDVGPSDEIISPGVNMVRGIAVHESVETNFGNMIERGEPAPLEECLQACVDSVNVGFADGVMFTDEEVANPKQTYADAQALALDLSRLHYTEVAPLVVDPIAIERNFRVPMPNQKFDLAGRMDVETAGEVIDVKTTGKVPVKEAAHQSIQLQMYTMSRYIDAPSLPIPKAALHFLYQTPKKTKTYSVIQTIQPTLDTFKPALARVQQFMNVIESVRAGHQSFIPADPGSWNCDPKWCGYAHTCPHYMGNLKA